MTSQFLVGGGSRLANGDMVSSLMEKGRREEATLVRQTVTSLEDVRLYSLNHLSLDVEA